MNLKIFCELFTVDVTWLRHAPNDDGFAFLMTSTQLIFLENLVNFVPNRGQELVNFNIIGHRLVVMNKTVSWQ